MTETAVTKREDTQIQSVQAANYPILDPSMGTAFKDAMTMNLEGEDLSPRRILTNISMPTGGATIFNYTTLDGDVAVKEITGIIVHIQTERALFMGDFGESNRPECTSSDGATGIGRPGGECVNCVENKFGPNSGPKPCKESKAVYVITKEEVLPVVFRVTPGSFDNLQNYRVNLVKRGLGMHTVETIFSLEKAKNKNGIAYAKLVMKLGNVIKDQTAVQNILKLKEDIIPFLTNTAPNNNGCDESLSQSEI